MKLRLALVKQGVPYDVAFALPHSDALAYFVALGEIEGGTWDWVAMGWRKKTP